MHPPHRSLILAAALVLAALLAGGSVNAREDGEGRFAALVDIDGAIGPATTRYVGTALATARERNAAIVILQLNTPGGLATSMREIIADVLASPVPVVGFVAPSGAHAASAGTYILYAAHIAAMGSWDAAGFAWSLSSLSLLPLPSRPDGSPGSPPICTGVAAPRFVPGAIAAICAA